MTGKEDDVKMLVIELLRRLSAEQIADCVVDGFDWLKDADKKERMNQYFVRLIRDLCEREAVVSDWIVLCVERSDFGETHLDASMYKKEEVLRDFKVHPQLENAAGHACLSTDEIWELLRGCSLPQSYCCGFDPWNEILGFSVDEEHIERFGGIQVATAILNEMTTFGLTEDQIAKEAQILEERARETDEYLKLPPEEREKHFIPAKKVYEKLGYNDKRTDEEKAREREESARECLRNQLHIYETLKAYCAGQRERN